MPQTTQMPVQQEFSTLIRSGVRHVYSVFGVRLFLSFHFNVTFSPQMCWSGFLSFLVSLPLSIFPKVENTK